MAKRKAKVEEKVEEQVEEVVEEQEAPVVDRNPVIPIENAVNPTSPIYQA